MKQYKMASAALIALPILFLATFVAWAEPAPGEQELAAVATEENTAVDAIDSPEVAEATGLDMVFDGSSLEAFEKSLEQIRETSSEAEYKSVEGALDYLLVYDLGAKRDREKLAARLDGLTPREIMKRVKWGRPK